MKFTIRPKFGAFIIAVLSLQMFAQESKPGIDSLSWLTGCWESNNSEKNRLINEQWMKPAGGSMIGMSRTVRTGKTTGFEFLRIVQDDTGIYYL